MNVGVGLPIDDPEVLLTWARQAEEGPFSTLGLLDRLVYDNPEPMVALSLLAGATTRIRLQTEVLLAPLREPVLLAKQSATLDRMSGGRFTLGLGLGGREDDFAAVGGDVRGRGARLDAQLPVLRRVWAGEPCGGAGAVGPAPARAHGPEVLFGGFAPAALRRVARHGDGFLCAGDPTEADGQFRTVERYWTDEGRPGKPRLVAQVNVALGPQDVVDRAHERIGAYYAFLGDHARAMTAGMRTTPEGIRTAIRAFADLGAEEIMLYCWSADSGQIARLADLVA